MTTQIAVRLPDDIVAFLDDQVRAGEASSRAALVARALERMRRAAIAERDAKIYASIRNESSELDGVAEWAASQPLDID